MRAKIRVGGNYAQVLENRLRSVFGPKFAIRSLVYGWTASRINHGGRYMKNIESALPPEWRLLFQILPLPIAWIPSVQGAIQGFLWDFSSPLGGTLKLTLFLLPAFHLIVGMWCTMLAVYTLPFRGGRHEFIAAIVTTWWDSGRAIALFWAGFFRALFLSVGWAWGLIRILAAGLYLAFVELVTLPFALIKRATQSTLRPGVPWIAVTLTLPWSLLEAGIFSYTLYPVVSGIASD